MDIRVKFNCRHYHENKIIHFHWSTRSNRQTEGWYFTPPHPLKPANTRCPSKDQKNISRNFAADTVVRCHQEGPSYQIWWLSDDFEGIYHHKHGFLTISFFPALWRHVRRISNVSTGGLNKWFPRKLQYAALDLVVSIVKKKPWSFFPFFTQSKK